MSWWHWLIIHLSQETGTSNSASRAYNFWSGFAGDIAEVAILGGVVQLYRNHNCSVTGCLRMKSTPVISPDGRQTPFRACRAHHPHIDDTVRKVTPERIATWHERHPVES
jgi:hypothetical protein